LTIVKSLIGSAFATVAPVLFLVLVSLLLSGFYSQLYCWTNWTWGGELLWY